MFTFEWKCAILSFFYHNYDTGSIWDKLLTLEYGTYKHMIVVHIVIYESDGISFNMLIIIYLSLC